MGRRTAASLCAVLLLGVGACEDDPSGTRPGEPGEPQSGQTVVPSIEPNHYFPEARRLVKDAGLRLEAIDIDIDTGGLSLDRPYRIIDVTPSPGTVVEEGSTVTVHMASRTLAECPDIVACYPG